MTKGLTKKQQDVLNFIRRWNAEKKMSPTLQQMAEHFGVKCSTIAYHVEALRKKDRLDRTSESRSIVLKEQSSYCLRKNCSRMVHVRKHADSEPDISLGTVFVPDEIGAVCNLKQLIACQMPDDSMFELGIHCGDILLAVSVQVREPEPGDVVVAVSPDGRTLIRSYYLTGSKKIELMPSSSDYKTEIYPASSKVVRAVVAALFRNY